MAGLLNGKQIIDKSITPNKLSEEYLNINGGEISGNLTVSGDFIVSGNTELSDKVNYKGSEIVNHEDLAETNQAVSDLDEKVDRIKGETDEVIRDLDEKVEGYNNEATEAISNLSQTVEENKVAAEEAVSGLNDKVDRIKDETDEVIKDLDDKVEGYNNEATEAISNLSQTVEENKVAAEEAVSGLNDKVDRVKDETDEAIKDLDEKVEKYYTDTQEDITALGESFGEQLITATEEFDQKVMDLNDRIVVEETARKKVDEEIRSSIEDLETEITAALRETVVDVEYDGEEAILTFTFKDESTKEINLPKENFLAAASFEPSTSILTLTLIDQTSVDVDMRDLVDIYTAGDGLNEEDNQFSIKIAGDSESYLSVSSSGIKIEGIDEAISKLDEKVDDNQQAAEKAVSDLKEEVETKVEELDKKVDDNQQAVDKAIRDLKEEVESKVEELDKKVDDNQQAADKAVSDLKEEVETKVEELDNKVDDNQQAADKAVSDLKEEVETKVEELDNKVDDNRQAADKAISDLKEEVESKVEELDNKVDDNQQAADKAVSDLKEELTGQMESAEERLDGRINDEESTRKSADDAINEEIARLAEEFQDTIVDVEYNGDNGKLIFTFKDDSTKNINLPQDNFLSAASYEPSTSTLTLTLNDETTFDVEMADLVDIYTAGTGLEETNNRFSVVIDENSEPYLSVSASGLKIEGIDEELGKNASAISALETEVAQKAKQTEVYKKSEVYTKIEVEEVIASIGSEDHPLTDSFYSQSIIPTVPESYVLGCYENRWNMLWVKDILANGIILSHSYDGTGTGSSISPDGKIYLLAEEMADIQFDTLGGSRGNLSYNGEFELSKQLKIKGNVLPSETEKYDLGTIDNKWKDLRISEVAYIGSGIITGEKTDIDDGKDGCIIATNSITLENKNTSFIGFHTFDHPIDTITYHSNSGFEFSNKLTVKGDTLPEETEIFNLGNEEKKWKDLWIAGNAYIGDETSSCSLGADGVVIKANDLDHVGIMFQRNDDLAFLTFNDFDFLLSRSLNVAGDILPTEHNHKLGSQTSKWNTLYVNTIEADTINFNQIGGEKHIPVFGNYVTLSGLEDVDITRGYDLRYTVTGDANLSFETTKIYEGSECIISILNNSEADATITITNAIQGESTITIPANEVGEISVRYVFSRYIIKDLT